METPENNRLIAEFMGLDFSRFENDGIIEQKEDSFYDVKYASFSIDELLYHSSWDWLMNVVERIEGMRDGEMKMDVGDVLAYVTIENDYCEIRVFDSIIEGEGKSKKESVYTACVEFIKWYNQQKK